MEHVYYANVTELSWKELEKLYLQRIEAAATNGGIPVKKYYDVIYDIEWSLRQQGIDILDEWRDKYLERNNGHWVLK